MIKTIIVSIALLQASVLFSQEQTSSSLPNESVNTKSNVSMEVNEEIIQNENNSQSQKISNGAKLGPVLVPIKGDKTREKNPK